jgi:hypothetical protein
VPSASTLLAGVSGARWRAEVTECEMGSIAAATASKNPTFTRIFKPL